MFRTFELASIFTCCWNSKKSSACNKNFYTSMKKNQSSFELIHVLFSKNSPPQSFLQLSISEKLMYDFDFLYQVWFLRYKNGIIYTPFMILSSSPVSINFEFIVDWGFHCVLFHFCFYFSYWHFSHSFHAWKIHQFQGPGRVEWSKLIGQLCFEMKLKHFECNFHSIF